MESTFEKDKILDKVKKTLNLAMNNNNEHEAKLAMLKAQEIMAKYNLSMKDVEARSEIEKKVAVEKDATDPSGRTPWWYKTLSVIIAKNFKCHPYIAPSRGKTKIVFIGLEEDLAISIEVFKYAVEFINKYATAYIQKLYREGKDSKGVRNDFVSGFLAGLKTAFDTQVASHNYAMVIVPDQVVKDAVSSKALKVYKPTGIQPKFSGSQEAKSKGYEKGRQFGSSENSTKKIEG